MDGGGTLGVMEAMILKHIMNTVTILKNDSVKMKEWEIDFEEFKGSCTNLFDCSTKGKEAEEENLENLFNWIQKVQQPLHPTEVFDMIVGTSTGELMN